MYFPALLIRMIEWLKPQRPLSLHPLNDMPSSINYYGRLARQGVVRNAYQIIEITRAREHEPTTEFFIGSYNLHIDHCKFCNPNSVLYTRSLCIVGSYLRERVEQLGRRRTKNALLLRRQ